MIKYFYGAFYKKLIELNDLLKAFVPSAAPPALPALPSIEQPKPPKLRTPSKQTKLPGVAPKTKKDPKKIAEQIRNPTQRKQTLEVLKFDKNGQWSLEKALPDFKIPKKISWSHDKPWVDPAHPTKVHADYHGYGGQMNEVTPHQKDLIHGIDLSTGTPIDPPGKTMSAGNVWITNPLNSKKMIVKRASGAEAGQGVDQKFAQDYFGHFAPDGLNAARREVLTHNIAHGLGIGQYFPTTAGFTKMGDDFSAQEKVDGYSEKDMHMEPIKQKYDAALQHMHDSGDLHKLAIFDLLMGNNDRHLGNLIIDKKQPKLHMIDAGRAIDYKSEYRVPSHLRDAEQGGISKLIHPKAAQWLDSMSEGKISQLLDGFIEPDSKFKHHFLTRLHNVKNNVKSYQRSVDSKEKGDIKLSEQLRNAAAAKIKATPESFAATQKLAV